MNDTPERVARLAELEARIEGHVLGTARDLTEIHDHKLYKITHRTWDLYALERWGLDKSAAWRALRQEASMKGLPPGAPPPSKRAATGQVVNSRSQKVARRVPAPALTSSVAPVTRDFSGAIEVAAQPVALTPAAQLPGYPLGEPNERALDILLANLRALDPVEVGIEAAAAPNDHAELRAWWDRYVKSYFSHQKAVAPTQQAAPPHQRPAAHLRNPQVEPISKAQQVAHNRRAK